MWTIHDLGSNDQLHPRLEAWFWRWLIDRIDGFICLSHESRRLALERFPALKAHSSYVVPHGHYLDAYPNTLDRDEARRRLGLDPDSPVVLHFGLVRPYKNVPHLIGTFASAAISNAVLVIAGKPYDQQIQAEVEAAASGLANVRLELRYVAPEEVQVFFLAADLVVLPYRRILNSGALVLAYSFARPALVPDKGSMVEHLADFGDAWIRLYAGELSETDLRQALDWARSGRRDPPDLSHLDWRHLAQSTKTIYEGL